jgi:uncharacterized protein with FMN-binding domain
MSGITAGALSACNSASSSTAASSSTSAATGEAVYTPGTYTGTAQGIESEVTVTMTFSETAITDVVVDASGETESIGAAASDSLKDALLAAQNAEIDGVSGATITSNAVKEAAASCIQQAMGIDSASEETAVTYDDEVRGAAKAAAAADGRVFGYSGPGDWLGTAPSFDSVDEEVDCDVCVLGLGHAGVQAVLGAAEKGAKVVAVESQPEDTFSWYGEDIGAWNSQFAQDAGFPAWDLGQVIDEFVTRSGGRADPGIVSLYVNNSGATLDHMLDICKEMGVDERVYTYDNTEEGWTIIHCNADYEKIAAGNDIYDCLDKTNYPRKPGTRTWPATVQFMGPYSSEPVNGVAANSALKYVNQACLDKAVQDYGVELYYGTTAQVLVQNDNGDVVGLIAKDSDGKVIRYNTSKGVVVCGGDYAGNADMCWALMNEYMERNEREGGLKDDFFSFMGGRNGSALKIMCWAGGMIEPAPRGTMILGGGINSTPWGANSMLWLNGEGKRFCNEGNCTGASTATARQKNLTGWLVTDKNYMKSLCACGIEHSGPNAGRPQYYKDIMDDLEALPCSSEQQQIRSCFVAERMMSNIYKCETLEELADAMGVPEDVKPTFFQSIEDYNAMCEAGCDSQFGKDASAMVPIKEGPFYGCAQTLGNRSASPSMVTMNGVMADLTLNVLDVDYQPIKGLYAAGNSLGGRYGTGYSTPCAGNSIGMAVTHGRLAGQFCAEA